MRRTGKPTNLYLNASVKAKAVEAAKDRYGCSLSEMVERLLIKEMGLKRGVLGKRAA